MFGRRMESRDEDLGGLALFNPGIFRRDWLGRGPVSFGPATEGV